MGVDITILMLDFGMFCHVSTQIQINPEAFHVIRAMYIMSIHQ